MRSEIIVRGSLLLLAIVQLSTGVWALIAPYHWFSTFPPARPGWVAVHEPFNHHLVFDAGTGFVATGIALLIAAMLPHRKLVVLAVITYLAHAVPHLIFHFLHPTTTLPLLDQTLEWLILAVGITIAGLALWFVRGDSDRRDVSKLEENTVEATVGLVSENPRNPVLLVLFTIARRQMGVVPTPWRALAQVPAVLIGRACGDAVHASTHRVPELLASLATLRAATLIECEFCVDLHATIASKQGLDERKVRALPDWPNSTVFDETERLVLEFTDALTMTPVQIPHELVQQLCQELGEPAVIELAALIGHENARARANRAMGVPPQGFAVSESCIVPEI